MQLINKNVASVNTLKSLKTLYYSLVYPHVTYGVTLRGSMYNVHISKLCIMQNQIIRDNFNANYNDHTR
jgi:hypothetical protein